MKKGKRIELPEVIIQHIQSFLNGKEAAQTTVLSKSWYNSWLTRPNLDFDQIPFLQKSDYDFWKFVNNTVERYDKLNLKIDSFKLWIQLLHKKEHSLVINLIMKALKRDATSFNFKFYHRNWDFSLPNEVFGFENLTKLFLNGCKIGSKGADGRLISCTKLESLILKSVSVEGNIIWDIISSCPLIENLSLRTTNDSWIWTEFGKRIHVNEFRKLKRLFLHEVNVHPLNFEEFSSIFPCLKNLAIDGCCGCMEIQISSPSLECISFTFTGFFIMHKGKFDVPRIRKFTFSGWSIPLLSFKTTSSNWESDISIKCHADAPPSATWFLELSKLLKKLSLSKVSLSLEIWSEKPSEYAGKFQGLRDKPKVENLTINGPQSMCPALFDSIFRCFRPVYVTQHWFPKSCRGGSKQHDFKEFVCKRELQQVSLNSCIAYQKMTAGECKLEVLSAEFYDESVSAWRPQLLDTSTTPVAADEYRFRLHLRWGH